MPTAAVAKLEKQGSLDTNEPLKQGIVMVEHKIRNLEKRKLKLDGYRDLQKTGKDLNTDQLEAISKYDAVIQHLEFAKELSKHLTAIAIESVKNTKKQARRDAQEKAQQDIARLRELMMIQDILSNMGQESIREDFLQGKGKITFSPEELQHIDDLYIEMTPKRDEHINYEDMFQGPAEIMNNLLEGKNKEIAGSTYSALKAKLLDIGKSGYFDNPQPEPEPPVIEESPVEENPVVVTPVPAVDEAPVVTCTFQPSHANQIPAGAGIQPAQHLPLPQQAGVVATVPVAPVVPIQPEEIRNASSIETTYFTPSHLRVFQSGTIDFMQDNELDTPDHVEQPPSIPTMTYTNQSFTPMEPSQPAPAVVPATPQTAEPPQIYQNQTDEEKGWSHVGNDNHQPTPTSEPVVDGDGWADTFDSPAVVEDSSWATQTEQQWTQAQPTPQHNDGFITQGGRGRGGRGRGGGDRNQKGANYNSGRGGNRGGNRGLYNNRDGGGGYNNRDGGYGGNYKDQNNYQNGYQNRNGRGRGGGPSSDRQGGGRGRGGGNRPSGGYRGGNSGGGYRQQQQN